MACSTHLKTHRVPLELYRLVALVKDQCLGYSSQKAARNRSSPRGFLSSSQRNKSVEKVTAQYRTMEAQSGLSVLNSRELSGDAYLTYFLLSITID